MYTKRTLCGLVILLDLAQQYGKEGVLLSDVAERHHIPIHELEVVIDVLCDAKLIDKYSSKTVHYILTESPDKIMMGRVFDLLYERFSGNFIESQTGLVMRKNHVTRFIHDDQMNMFMRLKRIYSRISLEKYLEKSKWDYR